MGEREGGRERKGDRKRHLFLTGVGKLGVRHPTSRSGMRSGGEGVQVGRGEGVGGGEG